MSYRFVPWYISLSEKSINFYSITFSTDRNEPAQFVFCDRCSETLLIEEFDYLISCVNERITTPRNKETSITLWDTNLSKGVRAYIDPDVISFSPKLITFVKDCLWNKKFAKHSFALNLLSKNFPSQESIAEAPDLLKGL